MLNKLILNIFKLRNTIIYQYSFRNNNNYNKDYIRGQPPLKRDHYKNNQPIQKENVNKYESNYQKKGFQHQKGQRSEYRNERNQNRIEERDNVNRSGSKYDNKKRRERQYNQSDYTGKSNKKSQKQFKQSTQNNKNQNQTQNKNKNKKQMQQPHKSFEQSQLQEHLSFKQPQTIKTSSLLSFLKQNFPEPNKIIQTLIDQLQNKQILSSEQHKQVLKKLLSQKYKSSQNMHPILKYFVETQSSPQIQSQFLKKYLLVLNNKQQKEKQQQQQHNQQQQQPLPQINLHFILKLHPQSIISHKKQLYKLSLSSPPQVLELFKYCILNNFITNDQLRTYDTYFSQNLHHFSLLQQIYLLQLFSKTQKKGVLVSLLKQHLISNISSLQLINKHLFQILLSYHQLKQPDLIQKFQQKLLLNLLHNKFNIKQKSLLIQLFHSNNIGSSEFWRMCMSSSSELGINELFGILSGMFRNNQYDEELMMQMIVGDSEIELVHAGLNEDEFLRVMLVYYGNYLGLKEENREVVERLIVSRLKAVYKEVKYKNNINMFVWLFRVEGEQQRVKQKREQNTTQTTSQLYPEPISTQLKLCYFKPHQKSLLSLVFNIDYETDKQDKQFMEMQYKEINKLSILQQIIIRRKQIQ